jgi:2,3-bisphosphoglycerate-dependent phosphoglycerate mutase
MRYNSMGYLILIRHGAPCFKPDEKLAGWMDIPLSREGIEEALDCAVKLKNIELDLAFTSNLVRTQETLFIILSGQNKTGIVVHEKAGDKSKIGMRKWYSHPHIFKNNFIPVYHTAALNERYYGKLQGRKKQKIEEKYGPEKLASWRWDFEPGPPKGESLKAVYERAVPYFVQKVLPAIKEEKNVIICAHQGSLRALVKCIEDISDKDIRGISFSTGELATYRFSDGSLVKENAEIALKTKINL